MKKLLLAALSLFISTIVISQSCLPEGIQFTTQEQIDNFQTNYPGCTEIEGYVWIIGDEINNLNGLVPITKIDSFLIIVNNPNLTSLTGLENLNTVGDALAIGANPAVYDGNPLLVNLNGLDGLTTIGSFFTIWNNDALVNLEGIENLISIGDQLGIVDNDQLIDLEGLESLIEIGGNLNIGYTFNNDGGNLSLESLNGIDHPINIGGQLIITDNTSLSYCEVESICTYLEDPLDVIVYNNATGCNSQQEVEEGCQTVSVNEVTFYKDVLAHPNPFTAFTTLSYELQQPETVTLRIYNHLGQIVYQTQENQQQGKQQLIWNTENYAEGVYYYRLQVGDAVANGKMVKVR